MGGKGRVEQFAPKISITFVCANILIQDRRGLPEGNAMLQFPYEPIGS